MSRDQTAEFDRFLQLLYEGPLGAGFEPALAVLREALGASAVGLTLDSLFPSSSRLVWLGLAPECAADYSARYFALDPWRAANARAPVGVPRVSDQLIGRREFDRSEFGGSFCQRYGVVDFQDVVLERTAQRRSVLGATFERHPRDVPGNLDLLRRAAPHASRALRLARAAQSAEGTLRTLESAFDAGPVGLLLLDRRGVACFQSAEAERCLRAADGISLDAAGRLLPERAVGVALAALERGRPTVVRADRISGGLPYVLAFAPAGPGARQLLAEAPWATVHVLDLARETRTPSALLEAAFGLTGAEARVALAVASGRSAKEAADHLRVAHATVRSQLLAVYAKTGVSRQSALARLVHALDVSSHLRG